MPKQVWRKIATGFCSWLETLQDFVKSIFNGCLAQILSRRVWWTQQCHHKAVTGVVCRNSCASPESLAADFASDQRPSGFGKPINHSLFSTLAAVRLFIC
eukprot:940008-Amphidinium_carterae.1